MRRSLLPLLLLFPALACAQDAPEFHLQEADLEAHLRFLASDELMGRRAGTPGNDVAARYLAEQFRRAGARPLDALDGYFQQVPLAYATPPARAHLIAGPDTLRQGAALVVLSGAALDVTAPVVFVEYGTAEADFARASGAIAVARFGTGPEVNIQAAFAAATEKRTRAEAAGAIALVECYQAPVPFANVRGALSRPGLSVQASPAASLPHAWADDAELCDHAENGPLTTAAFASEGFLVAPRPSRNVVAVIPGTDASVQDEYIALTAHFDHVGAGMDRGAGASPADSIFNGARDNGMGTVALLAAAAALAQRPARRSIVLIAYTAEEDGLLGSAYFADHPPIPLDQIKYALNVDTGGYSDTRAVMLVGAGRTGADALIAQGADAFGLAILADPIAGLFNRSDNVNLARKGIPAPTFSPGARAFSDPGVANYYHRPQDEADDAFDYAYLLRFAQAFTHAARLIADAPTVPTWTPGDDYAEAGRALYGR